MKQFTNIVLLSAGILLSLTGCQKGPGVEAGKNVRFNASTGYETRTAYSGVRDENKKIERIDWSAGDQIMVWSDNATVRKPGSPYFSGNDKLAVYSIGTITASDEKSIATVNDNLGGGLVYPDDNAGTTLWGVYPASAVTASPVNNTVSFTIDAEQQLAENANTAISEANPYVDYVPNMNQAYMLAYVSGATSSGTVELPFKPAFTDFEFNITTTLESDVTVTAVEITSTSTAGPGRIQDGKGIVLDQVVIEVACEIFDGLRQISLGNMIDQHSPADAYHHADSRDHQRTAAGCGSCSHDNRNCGRHAGTDGKSSQNAAGLQRHVTESFLE